jgi:hypothetical protein
MRACVHCGADLSGTSRRIYCCEAHRKRADRRRRAGLAESALPGGARRGRVALGQPTAAESAVRRLALLLETAAAS